MNRKFLAILLGIIIILFVVFPGIISQGAKFGLTLWFHTVLPALLPFMVLSNFMIKQNITGGVSRVSYPLLKRVFGLSREGCYPAVIGFLSGYPIGAKTTAQLYREGRISKEEAQYLLSFCNNLSPMFLVEYIGIHCMGLQVPAMLLFIIFLSGWLGSFFAGRKRFYRESTKNIKISCYQKQTVIASLDESILDAFLTITKIGGYIILFSILAQLVSELLQVSAIIKYIGIGILEITTGGAVLSEMCVGEEFMKSILAGLCAFGGLSSIAQTASVLVGTDLSTGKYLLAKIRQAIIAACLSVLWFSMG